MLNYKAWPLDASLNIHGQDLDGTITLIKLLIQTAGTYKFWGKVKTALNSLRQLHRELAIEEPFHIALTCTIGGTLDKPDFKGLSINDLLQAIVDQQADYHQQAAAKAKDKLKNEGQRKLASS